MFPVAIDTLNATFYLALAILVAGVGLIALVIFLKTDPENAKQVFTAVGVLFGLLAAGGVGGIFANKVAENAATTAVKEAGNTASKEISKEVGGQVAEATKSAEEATAQAEKATEAVETATEAVEQSSTQGTGGAGR
jgi:ABC-type transport system involved in cytochrome bd biosynthesis fused ATPase/permease subunit